MLIVDEALNKRHAAGNPIQVGLVGAGFSGRNIARQILSSCPGLRLAAISNSTVATAEAIYKERGLASVCHVESPSQLDDAINRHQHALTDDPTILCRAERIDVVIETTGTVEFGAQVVVGALEAGKHTILLNSELDATLGPILNVYANKAGVIYSNSDGDEPGVAMNLFRFVKSIGLTPVIAGNLKGLYDPYRNPDTQQQFAQTHNQKPAAMASFADGTKMSMELAVLANATGFHVAKRGMYGPKLSHVNDSTDFFRDKFADGGIVDFLLGAEPGNGAFVLGFTDDPSKQQYLKYLKMGHGPLYSFYTPFHLPQLEVPLTAARAVLFHDATIAPQAGHVCEAIAIAKKDLRAGETLDGLGGFCCYGLLDRSTKCIAQNELPIGLASGCRMKRDVMRDQALTYGDVKLPPGRLSDRLRQEMVNYFHPSLAADQEDPDETWMQLAK